jgi:hypothetical protein
MYISNELKCQFCRERRDQDQSEEIKDEAATTLGGAREYVGLAGIWSWCMKRAARYPTIRWTCLKALGRWEQNVGGGTSVRQGGAASSHCGHTAREHKTSASKVQVHASITESPHSAIVGPSVSAHDVSRRRRRRKVGARRGDHNVHLRAH